MQIDIDTLIYLLGGNIPILILFVTLLVTYKERIKRNRDEINGLGKRVNEEIRKVLEEVSEKIKDLEFRLGTMENTLEEVKNKPDKLDKNELQTKLDHIIGEVSLIRNALEH